MKRSERHHLKENELSGILGNAAEALSRNRRTVGIGGLVLLVAVLAAGGYWAWQVSAESRARTALGEAMMVVQSQVEAPAPPAAGGAPVQRAGTYPTLSARTEAAFAKLMDVANAYPSTDSGIAARYYGAAGLSLLGRLPEAIAQFQEVVESGGTRISTAGWPSLASSMSTFRRSSTTKPSQSRRKWSTATTSVSHAMPC